MSKTLLILRGNEREREINVIKNLYRSSRTVPVSILVFGIRDLNIFIFGTCAFLDNRRNIFHIGVNKISLILVP